jgi:beta-glucuronidase
MKNIFKILAINIFYSIFIFSQTATLEKTLFLTEVNGEIIPFQNGIPLPSFEKQNRSTINLAGEWRKKRFNANHDITLQNRISGGYQQIINESPDYHLISYDDSSWDLKQIPSVENQIYAFPKVPEYYENGVWYRYKFNVNDSLINSFVKLMFYSVNYVCDVWLNDKYLGYHEGGYTPFAFDVTSDLRFNEENLLAIRVDNLPWGSRKDIVPFYRCDWFNYTGIIHDIYLEFSNKVSVIRADIVPQNTLGEISSKIVVHNSDALNKSLQAKIQIFETIINEGNIQSEYAKDLISTEVQIVGTTEFSINLDGNSTYVLKENVSIPNPKLWTFNEPNLYILKITLTEQENVIDEYYTQFGVRTIQTAGNKALLNNKIIFLTGAARHEDHPLYGRSIPKEVIFNDFKLIDTSKINYIRTSHYPNHPYTYLITDRMGIAVMEEIPVWWFDNAAEWLIQEERQIHYQMFREMVFKDFNRPSILLWSASNECKEETNRLIYNQNIVNDLRNNFDDKRLITQSSAGDKPGPTDLTQAPLDVAGWTLYFGIFHGSTYYTGTLGFLAKASSAFPNKPLIDTEFGYWSSENGSNQQTQVTTFTETFKALKFFSPLKPDGQLNTNGSLMGTTWWCVFDWYSHQHPNGFQSMGLISMDRLVKKPVYNTLIEGYQPYYDNGGTVVGIDERSNISFIPNELELYQNYPNPFNPQTKIKYSVSSLKNSISTENNTEAVMVKLIVYDMLGNKVSTLVDKDHSPGLYEVDFDASELSSGIYYCVLKVESIFRAIKMALVK